MIRTGKRRIFAGTIADWKTLASARFIRRGENTCSRDIRAAFSIHRALPTLSTSWGYLISNQGSKKRRLRTGKLNVENSSKIILDLCGGTGSWSKPYADAGYDVRVITLPEIDVRLYEPPATVYGILAAPPCKEFSKANWRKNRHQRNYKEGMECVEACLKIIWQVQKNKAPLIFWALENPEGYLYLFLGYPYYKFQPWQFGEIGMLAAKRTALWGYFNKPKPTVKNRPLQFVPYVKEKTNDKWYGASSMKRAITPPGFAKAFFEANR